MGTRRIIRAWKFFLLGLILAWGLSACGVIPWWGKSSLPEVSPLPDPVLPEWIEQVSPLGKTDSLAQIRIRFKDPLIPLERLESPDQQDLLDKFEIAPSLPGHFRFLTPRMVGFQAEQALPQATRVQVTLKAGLADLNQHRLEQDTAWTFYTAPIQLTNLPGMVSESGEPGSIAEGVDLKPTLEFTSNVELDLVSVRNQGKLIAAGQARPIPFTVEPKLDLAEPEASPQETFDASLKPWIYLLTPQRELEKATTYQLEFTPGIRPAQGNLPSDIPFVSQFKTYAPLKFEDLRYGGQPDAGGTPGRFTQGQAELWFNNGLKAESVESNITVSPPPKESPRLIRAYEGDRLVILNPWSLEPNTRYTITLSANLTDQFGQTLGTPMTLQYETGDVAPDLWAPQGLHIFPSGSDLQLNLAAINLPDPTYKASYRVLQPTELVYRDSAYPQGQRSDLLPSPDTWTTYPISAGQTNQTTEVAVPLKDLLNGSTGMLAYGIEARTNTYTVEGRSEWRNPSFYGLVQLTNLGVFAQWFPQSGFVRVHHLDNGSVASGVTVEVYESKLEQGNGPPPQPCTTGVTDQTGTALFDAQALRTCMQGNSAFTNPPNLLVIAREGEDWAYIRTLEYSGSYGYGIYGGWNSTTPEARGTIFSDRQLYQPGETAWLTGTAYYLQNGTLQQDKNVSYQVTLQNPEGESRDLGLYPTNAYGTFSLEVPLAADQPLGTYSVLARSDQGTELYGDFRVAEFKPPNFKTELSLDREFALSQDTVEATAKSTYLFGTPVQGGQADYYVTREQATFTPQGWDAFSFGQQWFWPEEAPSVTSDVVQWTHTLDAQGNSSQSIPVDDELPFPMRYRVDVEVTDVSNLAVTDSKTFMALPSDRLIGLKTDFVAQAAEAFPVDVIVTNPMGEAIANQSVRLELQKMNYSSVTQVIEGSRTPRYQVEYESVAETTLRSGREPKTVRLTAPESGSYRIRANLGNANDERTATDTQIWITGNNPVYWGENDGDDVLKVQLDKDTYQPGEMATALIQSPYPEAELYVAVVRHNTLHSTITSIKGGAPQIQFQVTPDMLPNAAVEAIVVRRGEPLSQTDVTSLDKLSKVGFAPFKVDVRDKYLTVETQALPEVQPGASQTIQLALKDAQEQAVQGQFTVMVVNEAVLQLTGYRPPDLVERVYGEQPISLRFGDNRPDVELTDPTSFLDKGWGYGGGLSSGVGSTRIRTDFQPLAYYNGSVLTDATGKASVSFTLPDDLTTWRILVVATDGNLRFGNGDTTFITTQPLITNPILPQFARPGDRLDGGVSITNTTNQNGTLKIQGSTSGSLQFAENSPNSVTTGVQSGTRAYRFPMVVTDTGEGRVQFSSQLNGLTDVFEVPLVVRPYDTMEQMIESGVTSDRVTIPLHVDQRVIPNAGGLDISLASTLIPEITAPARQVLAEEQLPFLEPAASQLAIAASLHTLSQTVNQAFPAFNPEQQATQALTRLSALRRPDGGFGAFPGAEQSDPFVTPYAAEAIAQAQKAGLPIDSSLVETLKPYLQTVLADPSQFDYCHAQACKNQMRLNMLMALAALGDVRNEFLGEINQSRDQLDPISQIKLARYLSQFPEWEGEATNLINQIQETVYETGRTATVNPSSAYIPSRWGWVGSSTATQAEALRLFVARPAAPELRDRLVEGLLALRQEGSWGSPYDNASALRALVDYSQLLPEPPNFNASATLGGKSLASVQFQGYTNPSQTVTVPMVDLPRGQTDLVLQSTENGVLHYLTAYRYRLQGDQPGRMNGLRITRTIEPMGQNALLQRIGLSVVEPMLVKTGEVFDIGLELITDHPVEHVVITDPLPAGWEAVDTTFQTSRPSQVANGDSWEIGYQTIYRDRITAYADHLEAGVYTLHYLVRSVTPGTFLYPGAEARLEYAPEEFGRSASATVKVME